VTQELRADGTKTLSYRYNCTTFACPANGSYLAVTVADGAPVAAVYKDILHRTIRQSAQSFTGGFIDVDTVYDALGHVQKRSEPYFDGGTAYWTQVQYDLIGRPTLTIKPDTKTESVSYNGLTVTSTNGLNQTKTVTSDALGRVVIAADTNGQTITYVYDAIGELLSLTDAASHVTTMSYDIRGNKTAMTDPDKGS
jgi:YD repeat-containing protein